MVMIPWTNLIGICKGTYGTAFCAPGLQQLEIPCVQRYLKRNEYCKSVYGQKLHALQSLDFFLLGLNLLFKISNLFLQTFLLFMSKSDISRTDFSSLRSNKHWERRSRVFIATQLTVLRSFISASYFFLCFSPTVLHRFSQTPGSSSDPSQHRGSKTTWWIQSFNVKKEDYTT